MSEQGHNKIITRSQVTTMSEPEVEKVYCRVALQCVVPTPVRRTIVSESSSSSSSSSEEQEEGQVRMVVLK
jgi:hypothetical protein